MVHSLNLHVSCAVDYFNCRLLIVFFYAVVLTDGGT